MHIFKDKGACAAKVQRKILGAMLLDSTAWHYGLGISEAAGLAGGTIYSALAQLERTGWLESRWDGSREDSPRRRLYRLTGSGRRVALAAGNAPVAVRGGRRIAFPGGFGFGCKVPRGSLA